MRGLKKQRRIQIIILALVALTLSTVLIGYALRDGINLFRSPTQIAEDPPNAEEVFRMGGLVLEGSVRSSGSEHSFSVTDGTTVIAVTYTGILPDLFEEGQGTVATGQYINNTFEATEILAKHDETYMPREVVEALKEQGVFKPDGTPKDAGDTSY